MNFPSILESISDLNLGQVEYLLNSAKGFKYNPRKHPYYEVNPPVVATCFLEHSTRTRNSFVLAAEKLGAIYLNFDPATSSLKKGENLEETFLTLRSQGVDLCVVRTAVPGELHPFKNHPPFKIINGGDGMHQHPTQALLDLFTMIETGFRPKGNTMAIIGDCEHSRVCHSLIDLMTMVGCKIILCGPSGCLPRQTPHKNVELTSDVTYAINNSDLLYLLRIQKERHKKFGESNYFSDYPWSHGITMERLRKLDKNVPVYHPGPANIGIEIGACVFKNPTTKHELGYLGYEQVRHSLWMRMAIIMAMLERRI
ncbi:MAG: hypothetical protein A2381_06560 [Bdellovibrionales bacterium RIFOXYB1_FULL_37_110]|nr:MAG: hypothetical protein A2181_08580 [Bdellovibrionales bacterium RIFOXYA1_FULL_38_20]OFZ50203.1 MAG: hypothetical protein A2417_19410 [Bdellovibrionales bacterium RIFOXYC1_FULL_37_79]OFZ57640.1 MAG: hypothetical protein A2381_06560 [Bdellovibrionales bacterium RIFOXYB1_FULL_37_110]OFZ61407.1 MAG: hypothetical protein A2577_00925 [Bdellovibrionales bacterium RIFOXYD1_FULL_36_51]